jgi:ECF transporter S component (folate family)
LPSRDVAREGELALKTKRLVTNAMLIAIYFVFSLFAIDLWGFKITIESLPVLVAAALFGPVDGLIVGLLGSFMNQMLKWGFTATTLLWILPVGMRGLLVGFYARNKSFRMTLLQTVMIVVISALAVTTLNTIVWYIDSIVYNYPYVFFVWTTVLRYIVGVVTATILSLVLPPLLIALRKVVLARKSPD